MIFIKPNKTNKKTINSILQTSLAAKPRNNSEMSENVKVSNNYTNAKQRI